jgi:hypothetical protein
MLRVHVQAMLAAHRVAGGSVAVSFLSSIVVLRWPCGRFQCVPKVVSFKGSELKVSRIATPSETQIPHFARNDNQAN